MHSCAQFKLQFKLQFKECFMHLASFQIEVMQDFSPLTAKQSEIKPQPTRTRCIFLLFILYFNAVCTTIGVHMVEFFPSVG